MLIALIKTNNIYNGTYGLTHAVCQKSNLRHMFNIYKYSLLTSSLFCRRRSTSHEHRCRTQVVAILQRTRQCSSELHPLDFFSQGHMKAYDMVHMLFIRRCEMSNDTLEHNFEHLSFSLMCMRFCTTSSCFFFSFLTIQRR